MSTYILAFQRVADKLGEHGHPDGIEEFIGDLMSGLGDKVRFA